MDQGYLNPSDVQEIAYPPLSPSRIERGLDIDPDARPPSALPDDIQAYAWSWRLPKAEGLGDPRESAKWVLNEMRESGREPGDG